MLSLCLALTTHIAIGGGWNEVHPCIRYEQDSWTVGAFLNSEDDISAYASHTWQDGPWFVEAGVASGYSLLPVTPMLRLGYELSDHISLFMAPAVVGSSVGIVFGVELSL